MADNSAALTAAANISVAAATMSVRSTSTAGSTAAAGPAASAFGVVILAGPVQGLLCAAPAARPPSGRRAAVGDGGGGGNRPRGVVAAKQVEQRSARFGWSPRRPSLPPRRSGCRRVRGRLPGDALIEVDAVGVTAAGHRHIRRRPRPGDREHGGAVAIRWVAPGWQCTVTAYP